LFDIRVKQISKRKKIAQCKKAKAKQKNNYLNLLRRSGFAHISANKFSGVHFYIFDKGLNYHVFVFTWLPILVCEGLGHQMD
jgi:hypothetical protein